MPKNGSSSSRKKKKKTACSQLQKIIKPNLDQHQTGSVCNGEICSAPPLSKVTSTTQVLYGKLNTPKTPLQNTSRCSLSKDDADVVSALLPPDFYKALKEAVKKGILLSFLCTLTEDIVREKLKPRGYKEDHIYWINQTLKALILISGGMSIGKTLAAPFVNFLLVKGLGANKDFANHLTAAGVVSFDLLANPLTAAKIVTVGAVVTTSLATSTATHFCYQKGRQLAEKSMTALKETAKAFYMMNNY